MFVVGAVACQRLPEPGDPPLPPPAAGSESTSTTFLPWESSDSTEESTGYDPEPVDCDPIAQTNCATGEKCTAVTTPQGVAFRCVSDPGDLLPYDSCFPSPDGVDGCVLGHVCAGSPETALCVPLCESDADCSPAVCVATTEGIPYCANECSPFLPGCAGSLECRRTSDRFACVFSDPLDVGGQLAPCAVQNDLGCEGGFACLPGELVPGCTTPTCCTGLCDLSEDETCAAPSICAALITEPAPGFEIVGACFVPA